MKKMYKKISLLLGFLCITLIGMSQTGTLKVFTEVENPQIYIDEEIQPANVTIFNSITIGSHYLKVKKDDVIIYGELITISENATTTVLIKNDKNVQDKILASKYKEIEEYKLQKVDVLMSTNYISQSNGKTVSTTYPGYYVATGVSNSSNTTITTAQTDWFVVKGNVNRISDIEFARLVNFTKAIDAYNADVEKLNQKVKSVNIATTVTSIISLGFIIPAIICLNNDNRNGGLGLGILGVVFALPILNPNNEESKIRADYKWQSHYMSCEEALVEAQKYNKELKQRLGLPENYEP